MEYLKEAFECSVVELDREIIARGAQMPREEMFRFEDSDESPMRNEIMAKISAFYNSLKVKPDPDLSHISTEELVQVLLYKTGRIEIGGVRGVWGKDDRMDLCDIDDANVISNADAVALLCSEDDLVDVGDDFFELRVRNYGRTYNLCGSEPFHYQPVGAGMFMTGFLVRENIIVTAEHCTSIVPFAKLRIVFGYKMKDPYNPITRISAENIYKASTIQAKDCILQDLDGPDWAIIQLDRPVKKQRTVVISKEEIYHGQPVYVLGYPRGLPLKFAPGANIRQVFEASFAADLDIYSSNSGSPVFDADNHKLIGLVTRGDQRDYTWTGKCYISVIYPDPKIRSNGPRCTRFTEFNRHLV